MHVSTVFLIQQKQYLARLEPGEVFNELRDARVASLFVYLY